VKQVLSIILSVWIAVIGFMPCFYLDDCSEGEQIVNAGSQNNDDDCSDCAPLCICSHTNVTNDHELAFVIDAPEERSPGLNDKERPVLISRHYEPPKQPPQIFQLT
jgi:hypothetical protein